MNDDGSSDRPATTFRGVNPRDRKH